MVIVRLHALRLKENGVLIFTDSPCKGKAIKIQYTRKDFEISRYDAYILQLLDALKNCKNIPDNTPDGLIRVIRSRIKKLSMQKVKQLIKASYNYPPFVRAILGAIIELEFSGKESADLKKSLIH